MSTLLLLALAACRNDKLDDTQLPDTGTDDPVPVDTAPPCETSTWYADTDGDGYGDAAASTEACDAPAGAVEDRTDCDDTDADTFPGADERCDGQDNDCDGESDEDVQETWYADTDGDGHGDPEAGLDDCDPDAGYVAVDTDCDDTDATVNPDGTEVCNEVDDDCDGDTDEDAADADTWYADVDGDGFGDPATSEDTCAATSGWLADDSDCDDLDAAVNPDADEVCDGIDNDCDEAVDDDDASLSDAGTWYQDADGDGWGADGWTTEACSLPSGYVEAAGDCDDGDASSHPDALEVCDEADNDCDGDTDEGVQSTFNADADGDGAGDPLSTTDACEATTGYVADSSDCDDTDPSVSPWATETCNEVDDDCDGDTDEDAADATTWHADADGDGYGDPDTSETSCAAADGWIEDDDDCDDGDADVHPGADELCDGIDNDCDGDTDDASALDADRWYADADGDGFGDADDHQDACDQPGDHVADDEDCDDADASVNPDAEELCDGIDNDCDGTTDTDATDRTTFYADADGDSYGDADSAQEACTQPTAYVTDTSDCDDDDGAVNPAATEVCNDVDDDCDGTVDTDATDRTTSYADEDGDGYGDPDTSEDACDVPDGYVTDATDCDDTSDASHPGADEVCDDADNDCDGDADEDATDWSTWHDDADSDGYGDADASQQACDQPSGTVADATDCDDGNGAIHPAADETCDDTDNDCDGDIDEDATDWSTWYEDADGDSYGDADTSQQVCDQPSGTVADATDCDDGDPATFPGADETCTGTDSDCDGSIDEEATDASTWYADADLDGYGDLEASTTGCDEPSGYVADSTDCDDTDADVNPDAEDVCDEVDNDCDDTTDEGVLGDGSSCAAYDCGEILDDDPSAPDGTYYVDLGTGSVVSTSCEMDIEGGGWTLLKSDVVNLMSSGPTREHLYTYGSGFYISPATTMVWSWSSYQALSGTYSYGTGTSASGSFSCTHAEGGSWGIGCSNGGGGTYKCLTIDTSSASSGQGTVCQDQPDVFGVGACASNVYLWYREI